MKLHLHALASWLALVVIVAIGACARPRTANGADQFTGGSRYFSAKCNKCHPNGRQGAGPPIAPATAAAALQKGGSGRHGVPTAEWAGLITFMNTAFADGARETSVALQTPTLAPRTAAASGTDDALVVGERVFIARCNKCHPNGNAGVAPDLVGKPLPGPLVSSDPPGRHQVPPAELGPLLAFVASRGGGGGGGTGAVPVFVVSQGADVGAGASFYAASCNKCHPGGQAGVAPSLVGKHLPGPLVVSATTFDGRHAVPSADWENLFAHLVTLGAVR